MALSQTRCLDDSHVNPRTNETKPEFFYCEEQRLALEALLQDGREAFLKYLEARGVRGFLSDLELGTLTAAVEPFDPDSGLLLANADEEEARVSMQYWPELSDTSIPQMDLGWPDSDSYRGVTRTSVYTQPPLDGQVHIKEVVRKTIAQAQKVIAVVMDLFTDADIFRDLLDACFKRKVSVYILLERTNLPHFLSMCQRANMHAGHLKHLRVRCTGGAEFYTRNCTKVRGQMGHRFMFVDGDKAVSGSYSFTWMSSRLDSNLITVITGQTVDVFDKLFRFLYLSSTAVDLHQVATKPEPEPESRPQVAAVAPPSAAVARKMYNPKYALVALSNPSPTTSDSNGGPKDLEVPEKSKKKGQKKLAESLVPDAPPLHPGLTNLEKANLIPYLPIWPEPDPPSDVIGFINIRDVSKPTQVHLQRSEMFETSQAIKFSSPFSKPKEILPEVATPRQLIVKREETNKQPQNESKSKELTISTKPPCGDKSKDKAPEQKSLQCNQMSVSEKDETKGLETENKLCSNTTILTNEDHEATDPSPDILVQLSHTVPSSHEKNSSKDTETTSSTSLLSSVQHNTLDQSPRTPLLSGNKAPSSSEGTSSDTFKTLSTTSVKSIVSQDSPAFCPDTPSPSSNKALSSGEKKPFDQAENSSKTSLKSNVGYNTPHLSSDSPPPSNNKTPSPNEQNILDEAGTASTTSLRNKVHHDLLDLNPETVPQHINETSNEEKHSSKTETAYRTSFNSNVGHDKPDTYQDIPLHLSQMVPSFNEEKPDKLKTASTASLESDISHDAPDLSPDTLPQLSCTVVSSNKKPSKVTETANIFMSNVDQNTLNESLYTPLLSSNTAPTYSEEISSDTLKTASMTNLKSDLSHHAIYLNSDTPPLSTKAPSFNEEKPSVKAENTPTLSPDSIMGYDTPHLSLHASSKSGQKTSLFNQEELSDKVETASETSLKSDVNNDTPGLCPDTLLQLSCTIPSFSEKLSDKLKSVSTTSLKSDVSHDAPDLCSDNLLHLSCKVPSSNKNLSKDTETACANSFMSNVDRLTLNERPCTSLLTSNKAPSCSEMKSSDALKTASTTNLKPDLNCHALCLSSDIPPPSTKAPSSNEDKPSAKANMGYDSPHLSLHTSSQSGQKAFLFNQEKPSKTSLKSDVNHDTPGLSSDTTPPSNEEKPSDKHNTDYRTYCLLSNEGHDASNFCPSMSLQSSSKDLSIDQEKPSNEVKIASSIGPNSDRDNDTHRFSPHTPSQSGQNAPLINQEIPSDRFKSASTTSLKAYANHCTPNLRSSTPPPSNEGKHSGKTETTSRTSLISNKGHEASTFCPDMPLQSSNKAFDQGKSSDKGKTASITSLESELTTESRIDKEAVNIQNTDIDKTHILIALPKPTQPNALGTQEETVVSKSDSHTKAVNAQPEVPSEATHNLQTPKGLGLNSTSSASPPQFQTSTLISQNNPIAITAVHSSTSSPCTSLPSTTSPSSLPPSVSCFTSTNSLTSSASASSSLPPIPKSHTVHLVSKDISISKNQMVSEISSARRPETDAKVQMVYSVSALASMVESSFVKDPDIASGNSASEAGDHIDAENSESLSDTPQQIYYISSQEKKRDDGQHYDGAKVGLVKETKLQTESNVLITGAPKTDSVNINEIISRNIDSKTLVSTDSDTNSDDETTGQTEKPQANCELSKVTQSQTYLAKSHEPQRISFSKCTSQDINVFEAMDTSKVPVLRTSQSPYLPIDNNTDGTHTSGANTPNPPGKQAKITLTHSTDDMLNVLKHKPHTTLQEQTHQTPTSTPERPLHLNLSLAQVTDLNSPTAKEKSLSFMVFGRSPTPDVFLSNSSTPDSQTASPNPQSYIPDFWTPTSDLSDGYISPREDSTFSNTSEEYYQCYDSPVHEPVFEPSGNQKTELKENYISLAMGNIPSSTIADSGREYQNYGPEAATSGTSDQNSSSSETSILLRTSGDSSSSSLFGIISQKHKPDDTNEVENEIWIKRSYTDEKDQESQWKKRTNHQEANKMIPLQPEDDFAEMATKINCVQHRILIKSAADNVVNRDLGTAEASLGLETQKLLTSGLKQPHEVLSQWKGSDKVYSGSEMSPNQLLYKEMRDGQSTRETTGQKLLTSSSKPQWFQLQENEPSVSSRPLRAPRSLSASQVPAAHSSGSQTESKVFYSGFKVLNNASPHRPVSRSHLMVSPVGQKQVSHNLLSQQPPGAQIRSKSDQLQSQQPRPSYLQTHSNLQPPVSPPTPTQGLEPAAPEQEEGRLQFNLPFSRLYNFKGLRDKWTKLPAHTKRSSTGSTAKEHKSTN
nr:mucin-2 [Nothobranchius furzeri]